MKIKHTLASAKDKKATISSSEMSKLIGNISDSKILLYYKEINTYITYHKSRNGQSWYADNRFPKDSYLPKIGLPRQYDVEYSFPINSMNSLFNQIENKDIIEKEEQSLNLTNQFEPIRKWADERGIYEKGDTKTQFLKLIEEVGELGKALLKKDVEETKDAIGDIVIVLTNLTELANKDIFEKGYYEDVAGDGGSRMYITEDGDITIEDCINSAYQVIKNRKGKMQNGTFVKNN